MSVLYLIHRGELTPPVEFGLSRLVKAIEDRGASVERTGFWDKGGLTLMTGLTTDRFIEMTLERAELTVGNKPEGVFFGRCPTDRGTSVSMACGTDERGVMYALCELAARVRAHGLAAIEGLRQETEYPAIPVRVAGRFLMSERDDTWYFSEEFWEYYAARLAESRVNRLQLVTGFDTAYMSPPYPFLVETPGYEQVIGLAGKNPRERRERCLAMLGRIGRALHRHGVELCFGIWQQKPWTSNQLYLVENSPPDEQFADYAEKSIAQLLLQCPEIDVLSFRVNMEAGVSVKTEGKRTNTAEDFWFGMIDSIAGTGRRVKLDLRAKGLTDAMVEHAARAGFDVTVPTKAWCEHIGLPYQMLQLRSEEMKYITNANGSRRYSYDDLQRCPRAYDLQYRLWSYGTTNMLVWGEPYHVSRFIKSCLAAEATGFEFTAPLSLKGGHASIPGEDWPMFVSPEMSEGRFEDERYWMWYLAYGRLSYNPEAPAEIWRRELRDRFGDSAEDVEAAYISSGRILPLVTTAHFPEHPSMHYWPELYSGAALFARNSYEPYFIKPQSPQKKDNCYANALPSDETLFCSIERYIDGELAGNTPECYSPLEVADWYHALSDSTLAAVGRMRKDTNEAKASAADFTMLANLGLFHAWKSHAAYHLCRFEKTGNKDELAPAYRAMALAREAYAVTAAIGSANYARNLEFDAGTSTKRNGNWQDRLDKEIDADLADLAALLRENGVEPLTPAKDTPYASLAKPGAFRLTFTDDVPGCWRAGEDLRVRLTPGWLQGISGAPAVHYRRANMRDGGYRRIEMEREGEAFTAVIPGDQLTSDFEIYLYFTCKDTAGAALVHPGVFNAACPLPVRVIKIK